MKNRHTFLFLLAAVCWLLLSCKNEEISYKDEYMFGTDQQYYMLSNFVNKARIQETEDGCVLCHDDFIYYYNNESDNLMPLCSKGNCLHDHETDPEKRKACHACLEDFDGTTVEIEDEKGQTIVIEVPEQITVGEYTEKTISIEGYFLKNNEIYSCSMEMTAKNTESPDVFTIQLPEGAERFIGASAGAKTIQKSEHASLDDIKNHYPTQIGTVTGSLKKVFAGRTQRK